MDNPSQYWSLAQAINTAASRADNRQIFSAMGAQRPGPRELALMLQPQARAHLEQMAARAKSLTARHFGNTVSLYAPLYLSNYCSSGCVYCGYASDRKQPRRKLPFDAVARELDALKREGFEEILLLTGERTPQADFEYVQACVRMASELFPQVQVEAFPMTVDEYRKLNLAGCVGVTLYQETYHPVVYDMMHRWGPKKDFAGRVSAPAHVLEAGMRTVGMGVLLGLSDPVVDSIALYLHAEELRKKYWRSGIAISFPRIRPQEGGFQPAHPVEDRLLAQIVFAFRIVMPDVPLVLSTREKPSFRDGMAGVGISRMSAASRTTVGGYAGAPAEDRGQFEVSDRRSVMEICDMLQAKKIEPVFKNWDAVYTG